MEWISVKKQTPKYRERVLTLAPGLPDTVSIYFVGRYDGHDWWATAGTKYFPVVGTIITHWMPLPKEVIL